MTKAGLRTALASYTRDAARELGLCSVLACAGTLCHSYSLPGHQYKQPMFIVPRVLAVTLPAAAASGLIATRCSGPTVEKVTAFAVTAWSGLIMWSLTSLPFPEEFYESGFNKIFGKDVVMLMLCTMLCVSFRPFTAVFCTAIHILNCVGVFLVHDWLCFQRWREHDLDESYINLIVISTLMFVWVCKSQVRRWELQSSVAAEQQASQSLVSMMCDAGFWLEADGDTITRSDRALDQIAGIEEGAGLLAFLSEDDRQRFRQASSGPQGSVTLLHVSLLRADRAPLPVELFIVVARPPLGFLVGLRLSEGLEPSNVRHFPSLPRSATEDLLCHRLSSSSNSVQSAQSSRSRSCPRRRERGVPEEDLESGSMISQPKTLASAKLETLHVQACRRDEVEERLLEAAAPGDPQMRSTLRAAMALCCDHAAGGALVLLAEAGAFASVFPESAMECASQPTAGRQASSPPPSGPALCTSDGGYMRSRLRGIHVGSPRFAAAFRDFTEHTETDRWPGDHPDQAARDQPKDGALLLDVSGFRLSCATKILGLAPPRTWKGVGTKHEAALACAWSIPGCIALVRSDGGKIHAAVRERQSLRTYWVRPEPRGGQGQAHLGAAGAQPEPEALGAAQEAPLVWM